MHKRHKTSYFMIIKDNIQLLPIIVTLTIIPLIVRLYILNVPKEDQVWVSDEFTAVADLFAYPKSLILITMAAIGLAILIYNFKEVKQILLPDKKLYLIYTYLLLVVLSFLFSVNQHLSLIGYKEHYENVFVLISYIVLFLLTIVVVNNEFRLRTLIYCFSATSIILFLVGLGQYLGYDILTSNIGRFFVLPSKYTDINFLADQDTTRNVYQTLYHYNYVSFFAAIGFPFFLVLGLTENKIKLKFFYFFITALYAVSQIISFSRNGYIGFLISIFVIIIVFSKSIFKHWKIYLPIFISLILATSIYITQSSSLNASRIRDGFTSIFVETPIKLNSIDSSFNTLEINYSSFYIKYVFHEVNNEYICTYLDENDNELEILGEASELYVKDIPITTLHFEHGLLDDYPSLRVTINNIDWIFTLKYNEFYILKPDNTYVLLETVPSIGFKGYESFATERGYIWSRTLPLFSDYWLFGSGPDTYPLVFPQEDFVGKYNSYNTPYMLVDKPHNIYLNYGIHTGLISLIVLLLFWLLYIINSFTLYTSKSINTLYSRVGIASLASVVAYLASGIFNDTNLNVTPVFWIILGLGYLSNQKNKL